MCHSIAWGYDPPPRCAIKTDWSFLFEVMAAMAFCPLFLSWIRTFVSSARFSGMMNGEHKGFFKGEKGLGQGDPIHPYLFQMVVEGVFSILRQKNL